jgi:NAD(P)-dependent dehydrogenase (short-subunit alcohol dehydrogenase family)
MTESVRSAPELLAAYTAQGAASRALKRDAVAEDVANAIHFFVTADSAFVTGQILAADGGSVFH